MIFHCMSNLITCFRCIKFCRLSSYLYTQFNCLSVNLILNFKQWTIWQSRGRPLDRGTSASSSKYFVKYKFIHCADLIFDIPLWFFFQMAEGLFNFVIGWTFMFAPLLFSDRKRDRFKGSLDLLWGFQMFLTNSRHFFQILTLDCCG